MNQKDNKKQINSRIMKWRQMIKQGIYKDKQLLIRRIRKGIPASIRQMVWAEFTRRQNHKSFQIENTLPKESLDMYAIRLDIPRTFSFEGKEILEESLCNVLKAISIEFPQIGYCQGMNFLVMRLLQVLNDQMTFQVICAVVSKYQPIYDNFKNPGYVVRQSHVMNILLQKHIPQVYEKFKNKIDPILYLPCWFLTLYSKAFNKDQFCHFWDMFFIQGYPMIYKMALGMVKLKEKKIIKNNSEQNMSLMTDNEFYDKIKPQDLIDAAMIYNVTARQIKELEDQYTVKNRDFFDNLEKKIDESNQLKRKDPKIKLQWTIEKFLAVKVNLIQFDD